MFSLRTLVFLIAFVDFKYVVAQKAWNVKAEYIGQNFQTIGLGIAKLGDKLSIGPCANGPIIEDGFSFTTDLMLKSGHNMLLAPKVSYEITLIVFTGKLGAMYMTDFNKGDFVFRPEAGLSFIGLFYVLYGRNIRISNNIENARISDHAIIVGTNLPLYYFSRR